jgi:hypothetical protein
MPMSKTSCILIGSFLYLCQYLRAIRHTLRLWKTWLSFLGEFAKLPKAAIRFVVSVSPIVRPSVRPHGTTRFSREGFWLNLIFEFSSEKIQMSLKSDKNNGYFKWRYFHIYEISRWNIFRIKNVSNKICRENLNAFLRSVIFPYNRAVWDNVKIFGRAREAPRQYGACALYAQALARALHPHPHTHTHTHTNT